MKLNGVLIFKRIICKANPRDREEVAALKLAVQSRPSLDKRLPLNYFLMLVTLLDASTKKSDDYGT